MSEVKSAFEIEDISVNGFIINQEAIGEEMQHHPSDDARQAAIQSAEALVIRALLLTRAKQEGLVEAKLTELHDEEIESAIANLIEKQVQFPKVKDVECHQFFNANPERFRSPDLVEANHILLAAAPDDTNERIKQRDLALALIQQVQENPESFAKLAKQYSACPSKEMGGNLGQLTKGSTVPEFEKRLFQLDEGFCNEPIETRYGYHVVDIARKVNGDPLKFDMVEDRIVDYLNHQVYRRSVSQYIKIIAAESEIEGFELEVADSPLVQ